MLTQSRPSVCIHSFPFSLNNCFTISDRSDGKESACNVPLGGEHPLKKGMSTHSSILAWRIPWIEEPRATVHGVTKSQTWLLPYGGLTWRHALYQCYPHPRYSIKHFIQKKKQSLRELKSLCPLPEHISTVSDSRAPAPKLYLAPRCQGLIPTRCSVALISERGCQMSQSAPSLVRHDPD